MSLFFLLLFAFEARAEPLVLTLGKVTTLPAAPKASVHVGSKKFLQVSDLGNHLSLIGKQVGESHLTVGARAYQVEIVPAGLADFYKELKLLLIYKKGLQARLRDGEVLVTGQLWRFQDWLDIAEMAHRFDVDYSFLAHPFGDVATEALKHFQSLTKDAGLPNTHLVFAGSPKLVLPAGTDRYLDTAEKTFKAFGLEVEVSPSEIRLAPLVRTQVLLAEVSKGLDRSFGVVWGHDYQAKILPHFEPSELSVALRSLESRGLAKILAQPNLICRSGGHAEFLAGGEMPIRENRIFGGGSVVWKTHGVSLALKPLADASGAMSVDLQTEVSLLDKANAVDDIPAIKTNRVHSHFDLTGRKTIALSGLIQEDWGLNYDGLAGLASIPILGSLFRSQSFQEHKTELVVFVTPEVVLPDGDGDAIQLPSGWAQDEIR